MNTSCNRYIVFMKKKLFIFDLDGTIADTKEIVIKGLLEYSIENSLPFPDAELICLNYTNPDSFDFGWGVDKREQKRLMDEAFIWTTNKISNGDYVPKIFEYGKELIEILYNNGHILTICTSREATACHKILENYDLKKYFKIIKTRNDIDDLNKPKPHPSLILGIISETKISKKNAFIIGDTDGDILGGKNAGINTVAVCWGFSSKNKLSVLNPDYLVETMKDIEYISAWTE